MLLPALNSARERARTTQCLSNMKQISLACASYMDLSNGYMPNYSCNIGYETDELRRRTWGSILVFLNLITPQPFICPVLDAVRTVNNGVFPAAQVNVIGTYVSYGMPYEAHTVGRGIKSEYSHCRASLGRHPSKLFVAMDSRQGGSFTKGSFKVTRRMRDSSLSSYGFPHTRHQGSAIIGHLDGHSAPEDRSG